MKVNWYSEEEIVVQELTFISVVLAPESLPDANPWIAVEHMIHQQILFFHPAMSSNRNQSWSFPIKSLPQTSFVDPE